MEFGTKTWVTSCNKLQNVVRFCLFVNLLGFYSSETGIFWARLLGRCVPADAGLEGGQCQGSWKLAIFVVPGCISTRRCKPPLWISSDYTVRVFKFKSGECLEITALLTLLHNLQKLNMSFSSLQEESKVLDPKVPLSIELEPLSWPKQGLRKV